MIQLRDPDRIDRPSASVAILHEQPAWTVALRASLDRHDIPHVDVDAGALLARGASDPNEVAPLVVEALARHRVVINRISPSADSRGHAGAIELARRVLPELERRGVRVVNGSRSFGVETSKRSQMRLLESLGVPVPRTDVIDASDGPDAAAAIVAERFDMLTATIPGGPVIVKPDRGGSGVGVTEVAGDDARSGGAALIDAVRGAARAAGGGPVLIQPKLKSATETIDRLEFVGGELVTAMRVRARNTFNLCPDDACVRPAARPNEGPVSVRFAAWTDVPFELVELGRRIVDAGGIDIGGVEFIESRPAHFVAIDVNATSVHRADVAAALGTDPAATIASFLDHLLHGSPGAGGVSAGSSGRDSGPFDPALFAPDRFAHGIAADSKTGGDHPYRSGIRG